MPDHHAALRGEVAASADPATGQVSKTLAARLAEAEREWTATFTPQPLT